MYVLYNSANEEPTTTQSHMCHYGLIMHPNDDEDDWSVNISSDYEVVLTNTMTTVDGQNQYLSVRATDPNVGSIWVIDFQNSTYLDNLSGNNGNAGQLNSNGTLTIIVQGTNITFETAYGSVSTTVLQYYPSVIVTDNESYHATLATGDMNIVITNYSPTSITPLNEENAPNPTPTPTTAPTYTNSTLSIVSLKIDFWFLWLLVGGVLLIVGIAVAIVVADRKKSRLIRDLSHD